MSQPVAVPVSLFFDYACPFCYLASERLLRLGERHPLAIVWRGIEIHPDTPSAGAPGGLAPAVLDTLTRLAEAHAIPLQGPIRLGNSRRALLLAHAVLAERPERFLGLHQAIFRAQFVAGRNIGDPQLLEALAAEQDVEDLLDSAWRQPTYFTRLLENVEEASRLNLSALPALQVSERVFTGATAIDTLEQALLRPEPPLH